MMDFYLHKYTGNESITEGIVAPHRYRSPLYIRINKQEEILKAWKKDKNIIISNYVIEVNKLIEIHESFFLLTPPTLERIFIEDIIRSINEVFSNCVDLTNIFSKLEKVRFGEAKYKNHTEEELSKLIEVDVKLLNSLNQEKIDRAFIVDDVYATGKSLKLTKYLINKYRSKKLQIHAGVILKV